MATDIDARRLALTGSIPGLLRRGSPLIGGNGERAVVVSIETAITMYVAIRTTDPHPARQVAWYGYTQRSYTLDLTDPTGRYHALLWLKERGHDLAWAMEEPEVLAWSVLSVAGGGAPPTREPGDGGKAWVDAWIGHDRGQVRLFGAKGGE